MCFFFRVFQLQCSAQVRGGAVELTVSGLKAEHTDMYRCKIEVFYPPPYLHLTGNGTLIHVLGETPTHDIGTLCCMSTHRAHGSLTFCPHSFPFTTGSSDCHVQEAHRQTAPQDDEEEDEEDKEEMATFSVPVGALMILIIIVLIIIISFQVRELLYSLFMS